MEPHLSPISRPSIQHGKDRFGAFLGCSYRGVDVHVVIPERVHASVLTAHRADGTVAALSFPLLSDGQWAIHPHPQRVRGHQGVL